MTNRLLLLACVVFGGVQLLRLKFQLYYYVMISNKHIISVVLYKATNSSVIPSSCFVKAFDQQQC